MGSNVTGQHPLSRVRGVISTSRRTKEVTVLRPGYAQKIVDRKPADEIMRRFQGSEPGHMTVVKITLDGGPKFEVMLFGVRKDNGQYIFTGVIANGSKFYPVTGTFFGERGGEITVIAQQS